MKLLLSCTGDRLPGRAVWLKHQDCLRGAFGWDSLAYVHSEQTWRGTILFHILWTWWGKIVVAVIYFTEDGDPVTWMTDNSVTERDAAIINGDSPTGSWGHDQAQTEGCVPRMTCPCSKVNKYLLYIPNSLLLSMRVLTEEAFQVLQLEFKF